MDAPLLDTTKNLLAARTESLQVIAEKSGLGFSWLQKFACGQINNPTINQLQRLYDYLMQQGAASPKSQPTAQRASA